MPCYENGETIHGDIAADIDMSGTSPRMPPGYIEEDNGTLGVRSQWTEMAVTDSDTWVTDSVFKWSQSEIMARGWTAEGIKEQVLCCQRCVQPPMHST